MATKEQIDAANELVRMGQEMGTEFDAMPRSPAGYFPDWKPARKPPPDDRKVLIWWTRAEEEDYAPKPGVAFGIYVHSLGEWRPAGCNGNFNDQVTHWDYLPSGPGK